MGSKCERVVVEASARLHGGFHLLPSNEWKWGSLGFYIREPSLKVVVEESNETIVEVEGVDGSYVRNVVLDTLKKLEVKNIKINIENNIPVHVGLGSTTQIKLATATATLTLIHNKPPSRKTIHTISKKIGTGKRSLAGTLLFTTGGVIADAGAPANPPYTPLYHTSLPLNWRFILLIPKLEKGLHGTREENIFKQLPPASEELLSLARKGLYTFMRGVALEDIDMASHGLHMIQSATGMYFSKIQGGVFRRDLSLIVDEAYRDGIVVAQSSWGPLLYTLTSVERMWSDLKNLKLIASLHGVKVESIIVESRDYPATIYCIY